MGLKFFCSYFRMGVPSKLGMGKPAQYLVNIEQLLNYQNQVDWGNSFQQGLNILEIFLCGHTHLYQKGVICHISRIVTGSAKAFQDHPQLWQGIGKFFIQAGKHPEAAIIQGICSFWGDTQDFFPSGQPKISSGFDKLIIQKIIHRRPCVFKLRLLGSGNPLKFRIIPDNIRKVID